MSSDSPKRRASSRSPKRRHRSRSPREERGSDRRSERHARNYDKPKDRDSRSRRRRSTSRSRSPEKIREKKEVSRPSNGETKNNQNSADGPQPKPKVEGKTGGVYIPPFKLAMMQKDITDKSSIDYQKMTWEALKKSINGLVNKVSVGNIKNIIPELFYENMIRGRGLFCRSIMKAQAASQNFTPVYAALVAVVNTKMPEIGELLLKRLVLQFRKAYRRNNKAICLASTHFIAHLVNQQVVGVVIPLQVIALLLENITEDSVEVACNFLIECGALLQDLTPQGFRSIFDRFRSILHEGEIDKRVQYTIEQLFAVRKTNFSEHPAVRPELDLVDLEDQITHEDLTLEDSIDPEDNLNFFHYDEKYAENEEIYDAIKREILGDDVIEELEGKGRRIEENGEENEEDGEEAGGEFGQVIPDQGVIQDSTETDIINLRRTIYLTIMSSVDFNECAHKLLKVKLKQGQEIELCNMVIECCAQERTYMRFYGLLGHRFAMLDKVYMDGFQTCFFGQYTTIHRLETNKLRNVAKFFSHLLQSDAIPWTVLKAIRLNEEETTSSSRIFIKILFQELAEYMGLPKLNERLRDPYLQEDYGGIFPKENPRYTRFAINFFTSIGLGGLTEDLREHLKMLQQRKATEPQIEEEESSLESESESSSSESESSSSDSSSSSSESESEDDRKKRRRRR